MITVTFMMFFTFGLVTRSNGTMFEYRNGESWDGTYGVRFTIYTSGADSAMRSLISLHCPFVRQDAVMACMVQNTILGAEIVGRV